MSSHKQVEITFRLKSMKVTDTIRDQSTNIKQKEKKRRKEERKSQQSIYCIIVSRLKIPLSFLEQNR